MSRCTTEYALVLVILLQVGEPLFEVLDRLVLLDGVEGQADLLDGEIALVFQRAVPGAADAVFAPGDGNQRA